MKKFLKFSNYFITLITALSYTYCLVTIFLQKDYKELLLSLIVPCIGVFICTILRKFINAKRPYEAGEKENILDKKTKGQSFPSRHVFSIFILATTIYFTIPILGMVLFILGLFLCFLRVYAGVHYTRDVVCGAILGILIGSVLYFL